MRRMRKDDRYGVMSRVQCRVSPKWKVSSVEVLPLPFASQVLIVLIGTEKAYFVLVLKVRGSKNSDW